MGALLTTVHASLSWMPTHSSFFKLSLGIEIRCRDDVGPSRCKVLPGPSSGVRSND